MTPRIIEVFSPSSVICEKQSPCFLTCQATSYIPFNYSWTKDGQVPTGDGIKLMNNSIIVTPRDGKDYGEYVCHATNSFGSTEYKITLLSPRDNEDDYGKYSSSIFESAQMFSFKKFGEPRTLKSSVEFMNFYLQLFGITIYVSKAILCGGLIRRRCSV